MLLQDERGDHRREGREDLRRNQNVSGFPMDSPEIQFREAGKKRFQFRWIGFNLHLDRLK